MSNINNDPAYDPFPKTGYVRQYKNAILAELTKFLEEKPTGAQTGRTIHVYRAGGRG